MQSIYQQVNKFNCVAYSDTIYTVHVIEVKFVLNVPLSFDAYLYYLFLFQDLSCNAINLSASQQV